MKLKASDFEYLGIDLHDYNPEELGILKGYIDNKSEIPTVEELVKELVYQKELSFFNTMISCGDLILIEYKKHIYNEIYIQLENVYHKSKLIDKYPDKNLLDCFKLILEGMIKLRENVTGEIYSQIEKPDIADYMLYQVKNEIDVRSILKQRNIERLKELFEKENAKKD